MVNKPDFFSGGARRAGRAQSGDDPGSQLHFETSLLPVVLSLASLQYMCRAAWEAALRGACTALITKASSVLRILLGGSEGGAGTLTELGGEKPFCF